MGPRARILRVVRPEYGGPRKRSVLVALANGRGAPDGEALVADMIRRGELVMVGDKRGATYGLPKGRAA
jgi:hypothetical protein